MVKAIKKGSIRTGGGYHPTIPPGPFYKKWYTLFLAQSLPINPFFCTEAY